MKDGLSMNPIEIYLRTLERELQAGNATEHTHRPALKTLLETLYPGVTATNEPKRVACGAPDFSLTRKKVPLGHIETKDVGVNLAEMERGKGPHGEQFTRYRDGLPNWILTDYLEFRWYVAGQKRLAARLAEIDARGKLKPTPDGEEKLAQLLEAFIKQEALTVSTAKDLAQRMAGMTRIVRDLIIRTFEHEGVGEGSALPKQSGWLHNWLAAFREVLLPDLDEKQFADMFAQTLAYGLFAAKVHSGSGKAFSREMAAFNLPKTNPFLRKLFSEIAGVDMPDTIDWAVDDIVELLKHADLVEILKDFGKGKGKEDPVVHFYETFLAAYDPKMRELRGVYYTPEPVVSYIVRSIEHLLKTRFNRPKGLADENTLILDPACGTGTFLYFVIQQIYQKFAAQKGAWDGYVAQHLLNRLFGFELLMAPYAVAHLKLGMELQETGYSFGSDQRLGIYLTNTLEEAAKRSEKLFAQWISDEANAAASIKRDLPIMVVMGNPPYSGHSANRSWELDNRGKKVPNFIGRLLQDYYKVDGQPLGERNPKWLQDDYVKFLRFGQWRIERTGAGVLAFITNHGYLDNPTFRGMRQQLMNAFTEIYVLDLHGNAKKKEVCPDGTKDENVFDIQQGVALGIFVKEPGKAGPAKVFHADLWGLRESKYTRLFETDVATCKWTGLEPNTPFYLFAPQEIGVRAEYERGWKIRDAMGVNVLGFQTHRDNFAIDFDEKVLRARIENLRANVKEEDEAEHLQTLRRSYGLRDNRDWQLAVARKQLRDDEKWETHFIRCLYRPFDWRTCYFSTVAMDYPRRLLLDHVAGRENLCLLVPRQLGIVGWRHVAVSRDVAESCVVSTKTKEGNYNFPMYVYATSNLESSGQRDLPQHGVGPGARRPNLNPKFIADLEKRLGLKFEPERSAAILAAEEKRQQDAGATGTFGPEDVFHYIYAIFHSPTYRSRYAEFLKSDFPRVPLTSDAHLFRALCEKGAELVALHLLESPTLENPITGYPVKGSNVVEKGFPRYVAPGEPEPVFVAQVPLSGPAALPRLKQGRVYINGSAAAPAADVAVGFSPPSAGLKASATKAGAALKASATGQYFEGVPPEVWNFHIGGYQVCEKWLKDRRGRTLSFDDLTHYQKIITALKETIRLMGEIDAAIPKWPIQ
jgi:hypothetical protein